jgi:hypothetical protein
MIDVLVTQKPLWTANMVHKGAFHYARNTGLASVNNCNFRELHFYDANNVLNPTPQICSHVASNVDLLNKANADNIPPPALQ